ncbi:MAG TPA: hypothetical protein DCZ12_15875, partial [Gammaproteobacteria bacterium]|nr:hypothetical protein [Gammaproteobacteria bacterium]
MASTTVDRFNVAPEEGIKAPCRMATTANITLSGLQTIDTIVGAVDDRVLVKSQTDAAENGIYLMRAEAWVRAPDWNDNTDVLNGVLVAVAEGVANATNEFMVSFSGSFAIDTTAVTFINRTGLSTSEIDSRAVRYFDTLALLDAETDLSVGERVSLAGRFAAGDDGANTYKIVAAGTGTHDNGRYIDLAGSGLQAFGLFPDGEYRAKQWGVTADGSTDDTTNFKAFITYLETNGLLGKLPVGDTRLTSTVNITNPMSLVGVYPQPYIGAIGTRGKGSWLFFDHSDVGLNIDGPLVMGSVFLDKFGTCRTQPTPTGGWTPNAHDFDIVFDNTDLVIGDIMLYNPTKGIKGDNGNAGRLTINTLRGQPLQVGIELDKQYDAPNIGMIHFWPFWKDDSNVHAYTLNNLD